MFRLSLCIYVILGQSCNCNTWSVLRSDGSKAGIWVETDEVGSKTVSIFDSMGGVTEISVGSRGLVRNVRQLVDGLRNGSEVSYYSYGRGEIWNVSSYKDDVEIGTSVGFFTSFAGIEWIAQFQNGERHGLFERRFPRSGNVEVYGHYSEGRKVGIWRYLVDGEWKEVNEGK
jgi:hypothetical protein